MPKKALKPPTLRNLSVRSVLRFGKDRFLRWLGKGFWQKALAVLIALVILSLSGMFAIAQWYYAKHRDTPVQLGATFIPDYALRLGVDPQETMDAMITDLGIKRFRLVSYWENGEMLQGKYDFSFLDWQMNKASAAGAKVSLAIGLRQPRWPECHMPAWAAKLPISEWQPKLLDYITAVVERYKNHPALESWQLENEFFLKVFGDCPDHSRDRLVNEFNRVKQLDPNHTLVVSMSNNAIGTPIGQPTPDEWAISVYKRVWDQTLTKRYFEYPIPAWYYAFRAGFTELTRGHDSFIHELQAEAWLPPGYTMQTAPIEEFYKSLNPERLRHRFRYGQATGMKKIDLWGVEWWYYMKVRRNAPELWNVAREEYGRVQ
jgi:hypothetical protein